MNKELINKYKTEFDHWLNDGSVLIKSDLGWCPIAKEFHWSHNQPISSLLVINDEYVEFRKALAEGKTVQYLPDDNNEWRDCINQISPSGQFLTHVSRFRIKPIEFKLGNWITNHGKLVGCVTKTDKEFVYFKLINKDSKGSLYLLKDKQFNNNIELWQPKPKEWCWFWDEHYTTAILAKFIEMENKTFVEHHGNKFKYCAPFIGELPPHLKD